jgi:hypothetical protein
MGYLVESSECEHEVIRKLEAMLGMLRSFFKSLNLNPYYCWFLLEIEMSDLVKSFKGDVDILIGRLNVKSPEAFKTALAKYTKEMSDAHPTWPDYFAALKVAESGGIEWPPRTDYLVGIETKCSYLDPEAKEISEDTIKSKKSSWQAVRKIRLTVERLIDMGFDKVALLEFIANPPASGINGQAWMRASGIAHKSEKAMASVFKGRLPEDSLAGHWVCSIGAVDGGDETMRGSGGSTEYRKIKDNSFAQSSETGGRRQEVERNLRTMLERLPAPRSFPVLFINCKSCGSIHRSHLGDYCNKAD